MRRPSKIKKTEITRVAKGVIAAGLEIARVEIGKDELIVVVLGKPLEPNQDANVIPHKAAAENTKTNGNGAAVAPNDLDRELQEFEARHGQG